VATEYQCTGDEADEEGEEMSHGFGMSSTLTSGPRSAGVCGVEKVTVTDTPSEVEPYGSPKGVAAKTALTSS